MLSLKIENRKYACDKKEFLENLDKSCKQAILQQNGELAESTLQDLIKKVK